MLEQALCSMPESSTARFVMVPSPMMAA